MQLSLWSSRNHAVNENTRNPISFLVSPLDGPPRKPTTSVLARGRGCDYCPHWKYCTVDYFGVVKNRDRILLQIGCEGLNWILLAQQGSSLAGARHSRGRICFLGSKYRLSRRILLPSAVPSPLPNANFPGGKNLLSTMILLSSLVYNEILSHVPNIHVV